MVLFVPYFHVADPIWWENTLVVVDDVYISVVVFVKFGSD